MKRLQKINDLVAELLSTKPMTRDDDFLLIGAVYKACGVDLNDSMRNILLNHKQYNLPSFESITRARRKFLETHPEYSGNNVEARDNEESNYHFYYGK